ncbi:MAG: spermidine/putrescine ABC transporter substrate-binding protein [Clostridia bacterium]|nr:spermidine/putrescine ABC transporter substrate-binding protein [Clostridia bacterium]
MKFRTLKIFLSILMILTLTFSLTTVSAFADEDEAEVEEEEDEEEEEVEEQHTVGSTGITINVYNWGEYIANGTDDYPDLNEEFTKATGIGVNYTTFDSNESLYAKLAGGGADYDVIVPSDYMISKLINEGYLAELNFDNIPNYKYIDEEYKYLAFDPENKYSVPYTWGVVGLFYNTDYIEEAPTSWNILWDPQYSGKILMFDNPRDAFAIAQARLGSSYNSTNEDDWYEAAALLKEQKPLVQAYVMDQIFDKMESGEAWLAPYYCGDAAILCEEVDNIDFVFPEEGSNFFVDSMCVLASSTHKAEAEAYINFMCDPEISGTNMDYVGYASPETEAKQYMDESIAENPINYPTKEVVSNTEVFAELPAETGLLLDTLWAEVKMGGPGTTITLIAIIAVFLGLYIGIVVYKRQKRKREMM